jgi:cation:H+ antiporter
MIPLVYSLSAGRLMAVPLDGMHRHEVLLTILQSLLGMVLLMNMRYSWWEALVLFVLWFIQFCVPSLRVKVIDAYAVLIVAGIVQAFFGGRSCEAFTIFGNRCRRGLRAAPAS